MWMPGSADRSAREVATRVLGGIVDDIRISPDPDGLNRPVQLAKLTQRSLLTVHSCGY